MNARGTYQCDQRVEVPAPCSLKGASARLSFRFNFTISFRTLTKTSPSLPISTSCLKILVSLARKVEMNFMNGSKSGSFLLQWNSVVGWQNFFPENELASYYLSSSDVSDELESSDELELSSSASSWSFFFFARIWARSKRIFSAFSASPRDFLLSSFAQAKQIL